MEINYLFPPDVINDLPSWRFVLHFIAPEGASPEIARQVVNGLEAVECDAVEFACEAEDIELDETQNAVSIPIEVPEERRRRENGLAAYESDVWKIIGTMTQLGFSGLYYEAFDWDDE